MSLASRLRAMLPVRSDTDPPEGMYRQHASDDDNDLISPFDPVAQSIFCSFCGRELVPGGHLTLEVLLCPQHGEFTIAPMVIKGDNGWRLHFRDSTEKGMWETCDELSQQGAEDGTAQVGGIRDEPMVADSL